MEALAVVQTVSSIVQLVEFGSKCLKEGLQLYHQSSGVLDENLAIEATATHLSNLNNAVTASALTLTDASLKDLCDQITPTAKELLDALEQLKLEGFQRELNSHISVSTRDKLESLDAHIIARFDDCNAHTREILDAIRNSSDLFQTALNDHSVLLQGLEKDIRRSLQTSQAVIQQDIRDTASHTETVIQGQHSETQLIVREESDRVIKGNADSIRGLELRV
ncbi:hypothetical protein C7974DRAFT_415176 [Boeremia exigua]|uniref:uncharacterized protein n=1 Tax=Boeremia exigua TaxID=749465 RepID=UPI001E8D2B37|nr:uncharacterized protein C7974DRAFT_415176 [Boeremia exigua]KAH6619923.1 hypothetical protein C7974DRAFT_415176 [Boeremia exigua]